MMGVIRFERCGIDIKCHVGESLYILEKFNQDLKKELVTGLFFEQLIEDWNIVFILDTVIKKEDNNFFNEEVAPKLFLPYCDAVDLLTKKVRCREKAELMIEFMIHEEFYERDASCLKFFPDLEVYSKIYIHSMNAYLRSVSIKMKNSEELKLLKELSSLFLEKKVKEHLTEDELRFFADECKSIISRGLNEILHDEDIHQLIQKLIKYIYLNRSIYPDKTTLKRANNKGKLEDVNEINFKTLLAVEMIKSERERLRDASKLNKLIEEISNLSKFPGIDFDDLT
jgi:hypothetical protein